MWIKAITDRAREDVDYARANANNAEHLKGALDYEAWNRISGNLAHIAEYSGYSTALRTGWALDDFPTESDAADLMLDLTELRARYAPIVPELPEYPTLHFEVFNLIESIIAELERLYRKNEANKDYLGEIYAGEEIGVI